MASALQTAQALRIRRLRRADLADVTRIDAHHTGARKPAYWKRVLEQFLGRRDARARVGLAAEVHGRLAGYLLGEASRTFRAAGVTTLRTMVRRNDVPVLAFFRAAGFSGGSYVQLELDLSGQG